MKQPLLIKIIRVLAWLHIASFLLITIFVLTFGYISYYSVVITPNSEIILGMREGGLQALGCDPATFDAHVAGRVIGYRLIPALLDALILIAIQKRLPLLFRVAASIMLLSGLVRMRVPVHILIGILAWLPATGHYLKAKREDENDFQNS